MNKIFAVIISIFLFSQVLVPVALAQDLTNPCPDPTSARIAGIGCIPTSDPIKFSVFMYNLGLSLVGVVGLLSMMYGGYMILSSRGDAYRIKEGKRYIYYALAGIVLAFSGLAVYQIIGGDVLKIPGFTKTVASPSAAASP